MGDGFVCNRAVSLVVTAYHMNEVPATRMTTDTEHQAWVTHGRNECIGVCVCTYVCLVCVVVGECECWYVNVNVCEYLHIQVNILFVSNVNR